MRRHVMVNTPASHLPLIQFAQGLQSVLLMMLLSISSATAQPAILTVEAAYNAAQSGKIILVDIRTPKEWSKTGIGDGAVALDMTDKTFIPSLIALRESHPDTKIAFICATGGRSAYLNRYLWKNGFYNTADVTEGMLGSRAGPGWLKAKLPTYPGKRPEIETRLRNVLP